MGGGSDVVVGALGLAGGSVPESGAAGAGAPRDDQYAALFGFIWFERLFAFALP